MKAEWIFKELRPGDKDRQPTQREFFATDAIDSMVEALVRESIQNSMDAGGKLKTETVRVRFHLARGSEALLPAVAARYFNSGWGHYSAKNNGLNDVPGTDESCPFLVVEDFGTTGLTGDINQWMHVEGLNNPFYYFFRTEGRSGKGGEERGRWGIGKYVFPGTSRIRSFVALTIRHDDKKRLLMGQSILKSHILESKYYTPDGDYGRLSTESTLVLPVEDDVFIERFREDFKLSRQTEPGLSIVVPWVIEDVTKDRILHAVIKNYFYTILKGQLVVTVSDETGGEELNCTTLYDLAQPHDAELSEPILPFIALAKWHYENAASKTVRLESGVQQKPQPDGYKIPEAAMTDLRTKYRAGEIISVTVPVTVNEKRKAPRTSQFTVTLVNDGCEAGKSIFVRDDLIISDVHGRRVPGVRALVIVEDPALATLLGDSENPAHTQWQKDRDNFCGKYTYPQMYISFVSHSASMLVRMLNESDEKPDRELLKDIFAVPKLQESEGPKEKYKPRKRNGGDSVVPDINPEPRARRYMLAKIASGFTITQGDSKDTPAGLVVRVAYDRRRGSPLGKYATADFKMNEPPIKVAVDGGTVEEKQANTLTVKITRPEFNIKVTGFDENRDLFVDVRAKEAADDTQA